MSSASAVAAAAVKPTNAVKLSDLPELNFPKMEEQTLAYWKEIDAFKTSLKKSEGRKPFTFYDGPPFATGLPHYGHILAGTIKDVVCRFAHQTGHHVERRFGWDCHGLPIEFEIEKDLGIKSSHDVKKMGIDNYNKECRKIVSRFAAEWEVIVTRCGRWIDFKDDYKTMNLPYMESVWWVFKQLWEKKLVYRGFKVMPYSTACTTPLSNFECGMNYKDVSDPSAIVSFPIVGSEDQKTHLLAWTTTPWTLPSNLALVVHPEFDYLKVLDAKTNREYIFAECRLDYVYKNHAKAKEKPFKILDKVKGSTLVGTKYVPLFPYFQASLGASAFRVIADTYVTQDSGTGIVHSAPGFGEDDCRVCLANQVIAKGQTVCPVDENGCFTSEVADWAGKYIKDCDDDILKKIKESGRLIDKAAIVHSYPFCWRSETPLIYKAVDAWFVNVESIREDLLKSSESTRWVPEFVQTKRFHNWLVDARDWNVSRNRYWGTPLPVWVSDDMEEMVCVGSVAELEALSGVKGIDDIHREFVDKITIPSKREGHPPLRRIEQVFDCWFESGSMPYAQRHHPFENQETFEQHFPADFIAEGLDQTRGWFYTLLVLSTALFGKAPFKNLVVNGLVLAADGKKMSKRLKNYPPVDEILNECGADALRLFLINSPVVRAEPLKFRKEGVKEVIRDVFLPLCNAVKFFVMNANLYMNVKGGERLSLSATSSNDMDRWIAAAGQTLVKYVDEQMQGYKLYTVVPGVLRFVETLSNWYVRMNRRRLKGQDGDTDMGQSLNALFQVLYVACRVLAPFTPFLAEQIYQVLKPLIPEAEREDSVHYVMLPHFDASRIDAELEESMQYMIDAVDLVRVLRDRKDKPMKMPVKKIVVIHSDANVVKGLARLEGYIKTEVNAMEIEFTTEEGEYVVRKLEANFATLGKRLKKEVGAINGKLKAASDQMIRDFFAKGKITIDGYVLTEDDVKVSRSFRDGIKNYETNTDGQLLVLMNTEIDEALIERWRAREFVSRVQQLRKEAGLVVTDAVCVYYESEDPSLMQSIASAGCREVIGQTIKSLVAPAASKPAKAEEIKSKAVEIGEVQMTITLTKAEGHKDPNAQ